MIRVCRRCGRPVEKCLCVFDSRLDLRGGFQDVSPEQFYLPLPALVDDLALLVKKMVALLPQGKGYLNSVV